MGEIIYGPLPEENRPRRFMPIVWMVLGACLALGGEHVVEFIPKGEPAAQAAQPSEELVINWANENGLDVNLITWPSITEVKTSQAWEAINKEGASTDTILVSWPWTSPHRVAYRLDPTKAKQLLELYGRTTSMANVDGVTSAQP